MPARLGRYAVRRRIGSGGFATVWLAYDEQLDSPVAVKVLADNWTEDAHVRQRFLEEGRYLRRVESPHVVGVYDAGELDDGRPYLVMTYADQGTLADRLAAASAAGESLTVGQSVEVVRQVALGLQALHDRDILHRDVKPANVLFRTVSTGPQRGEVRTMLGDLGLGKALDVSSRLTMVAGTPSFVAPEQARAETPDARADQYSLAALTFLLLAGRAPYAHTSLNAAAEPAPPPSLSTPERPFPAAVDAVVRRGLALRREDRFPDVTAYAAALTQSLEDGFGAAATVAPAAPWLPIDPDLTQPGARPTLPPVTPMRDEEPGVLPRRRRRPLRILAGLVAALGVLAAAGVGGYEVQQHRVEEVTVDDLQGQLSVTVPASWDRSVSTRPWRPPDAEVDYPALSVGSAVGWETRAAAAPGVFVALLPGAGLSADQLPSIVPRHPGCTAAGPVVQDTVDGDTSVTVTYTGCPGGVQVERVVQVTTNQLLWVQIRSADRATANQVLDAVQTHGMG